MFDIRGKRVAASFESEAADSPLYTAKWLTNENYLAVAGKGGTLTTLVSRGGSLRAIHALRAHTCSILFCSSHSPGPPPHRHAAFEPP